MSFEVQAIEFSVKAWMTCQTLPAPRKYYYEVGIAVPYGVVIVMFSGEFVQL